VGKLANLLWIGLFVGFICGTACTPEHGSCAVDADVPVDAVGDSSQIAPIPLTGVDAGVPDDGGGVGRVVVPDAGGPDGSGTGGVDGGTGGVGGQGGTATVCPLGVELNTDKRNCGACGFECVGGRSCDSGRCTPAWIPVSRTGAPSDRTRHSASLINGRVLLSGGTNINTGTMPDSHYYDPATDTWTPGPNLKVPRYAHTSVTASGRVILFGGQTVGAGLEEYDPDLNSWTRVDVGGGPEPGYNGAAIAISSRDLLILGGNGSNKPTSRYNPINKVWIDVTCSTGLCGTDWMGLFTLNPNTIVAWGGWKNLAPQKFDPATNHWSAWQMPTGGPPQPTQFAESDDTWFVVRDAADPRCSPTINVRMFSKAKGFWRTELTTPPIGVVPEYDTTNSTVWTGKELFIWSGTCSRPAVGARYQPPAM
jgi:Galactose oxidase, central domain